MLNRQDNWRASMRRQASVKRPSKSEVSDTQFVGRHDSIAPRPADAGRQSLREGHARIVVEPNAIKRDAIVAYDTDATIRIDQEPLASVGNDHQI
jgi:hypothetical protein